VKELLANGADESELNQKQLTAIKEAKQTGHGELVPEIKLYKGPAPHA